MDADLFSGNGRSHSFNRIGVPAIDMVESTREPTSMPFMTNDDLHTLKRYEETLGDAESKRTHHNRYRVCYRNGKCMLSSFYCEEFKVCVCVLMDQGRIKIECNSVVINA